MEKTFLEWIVFLLQKYGMEFLKGMGVTVIIAMLGTLLGFLIGFIMGIIQTIPVSPEQGRIRNGMVSLLKRIVSIYVTVFRGTPMMVQAMVIYYGSSQMLGWDMPSFGAAVLVLSINTGAYMAETVRGGILSIDPGQMEGAIALGMSHVQLMQKVVLPQAFRNLIPQMGNMFVTNIKDTSVLNIISVTELFFATKTISGAYYRYFEAYTITAAIYLFLTIIADRLLKILESVLNGKADYEMVSEEELRKLIGE